MDCKGFEDLISAYADGETTREESRQVEAHLKACQACTLSLALARRSKAVLASMPAPEAPADLKASLMAAAALSDEARTAGVFKHLAPWRQAQAEAARASGPASLDQVRGWLASLSPRHRFAFGLAAFLLVGFWFGRPRDEAVPIDLMLSAHRQYALAQPLAQGDSVAVEEARPEGAEDDETDE